jgi:hypothetical protein
MKGGQLVNLLLKKAPELTSCRWLVDEEEEYRMFGGYLPVGDAQPKISSLKHRGNSVHKEKKMRILKVMFQKV